MRRLKLLVVLCLLGAAVGLRPAVAQAAQADPQAKLIEGAKKEGEVVWYTTTTLDQSQQVVERFQKKYPFVKATLFRTGGGPLLSKILTEARGGLYAWDVVVGRGEMVLPLIDKKLLAMYASPERKMIYPDLADKQGYWTAWYVNAYVLGWNTKLVKKDDVPKPTRRSSIPNGRAETSPSIPRPTACSRA